MEGVSRTRGMMRVGSRNLPMAWKIWVAMVVIGAGVGDAFALPVLALCDPGTVKATCCCTHDCPSNATTGAGLRSTCCDMRSAPARDAMPSIPPREAAPVSLVSPGTVPVLPLPEPPILADAVSGVPKSLHAPPLYDLFRSYRI
jgi:hypothetical protein